MSKYITTKTIAIVVIGLLAGAGMYFISDDPASFVLAAIAAIAGLADGAMNGNK